MPGLSIIIPTFNSAATIQRCLRSIHMQKFTDYEILIQDGRSTDQTIEMVDAFRRQNPHAKVELRQERDEGVYDAMNRAVRRARGDWFYFLGSDDELHDEDTLGNMLENPAAARCDVLYGNVQYVGATRCTADGTIYDGPFNLLKLLDKNVCHQAMFYRADFFRRIGFYNPRYGVLADWDFNMRCWASGRPKYVDIVIAKFYADGISSHGQPDLNFQADKAANVTRYFGMRVWWAKNLPRLAPKRVFMGLARRLGRGQ